MADEKTEDSKSPIARRGARPFAGPSSAPSAARPFLRPAASQRSGPSLFAPQGARPRPALGTTPPAAPPRPEPVAASPAAAPAERVTRQPTPVAVAPVLPAADPDPFFPVEPIASATDEPAKPARPITSEMVALDAFDAFDAVWGGSDRRRTPASPPATTPPLDASSLGSGLDGHDVWAEDITAAGDHVAPAQAPIEPAAITPSLGMPAWLADDREPTPTASDAAATDVRPIAPEAVDEPALPTWAPPAASSGYSSPDWTDSPAMAPMQAGDPIGSPIEDSSFDTMPLPAAEDIGHPAADAPQAAESLGDPLAPPIESHCAVTPEVLAVPDRRPRFELVEPPRDDEPDTVGAHDPTPAMDPRVIHGFRVSATLDRLAERVRAGEIDVSSVAPEATDAAVLASVLAALLGGSSSR